MSLAYVVWEPTLVNAGSWAAVYLTRSLPIALHTSNDPTSQRWDIDDSEFITGLAV